MRNSLIQRIFVLLLCFSIWNVSVATANQFDEAVTAYSAGNYQLARELWTDMANQGDTLSQFNLGIMYEQGLGIKRDISHAIGFYTLAATANYAPAQLYLANIFYSWFKDSPENMDHAIYWWTQAAIAGEPEAQYQLGKLYVEGVHITYNHNSAKHWLGLAAEQNHDNATSLLLELEYSTNFFTPRESWIQEQYPDSYTLLIYTANTYSEALEFVNHAALTNFAIFESAFGSQNVISGVFVDKSDAEHAITHLPDQLKAFHPFIQRFDVILKEISDLQSPPSSLELAQADSNLSLEIPENLIEEINDDEVLIKATPTASESLSNTVISQRQASSENMTESISSNSPENTETIMSQTTTSPVTTQLQHVQNIVSRLGKWADAWSNRDISLYLSFYSVDFNPTESISRTVWVRQRANSLNGPANIRVSTSNMTTQILDDWASVEFIQTYRSDIYSDTVKKILELKLENGNWSITSENQIAIN